VINENLTRAEAIEVIRQVSETAPRGGKGRVGAVRAKGRKVTTRSFRVVGCKLVIEKKRGRDDRLIGIP
jgi:hypothetical protein